MQRPTLSWMLFALLAVAPSACGKADVPFAQDAGAPERSDASTPTPAPTTSTPDDTKGTDAAPPSAGEWCKQGTHLFCADFDGAVLLDGWDSVPAGPFGAIQSMPANGVGYSLPNELVITHPAATTSGPAAPMELVKQLAVTSPSTVRVSLQLSVPATGLDDLHPITPLSIELTSTTEGQTTVVAGTRLDVGETRSTLLGYGPGAEGPDAATAETHKIPRGRWFRLDLVVDVAGNAVRTKFDEGLGAFNSLGVVTLPLAPGASIDGVRLKIGALRPNYCGSHHMTFDSVVVDVP